jgi:hypothetical protein
VYTENNNNKILKKKLQIRALMTPEGILLDFTLAKANPDPV